MQSTFKTVNVQENNYNISDRKNFGDKVVYIDNIKLVVSLIV